MLAECGILSGAGHCLESIDDLCSFTVTFEVGEAASSFAFHENAMISADATKMSSGQA